MNKKTPEQIKQDILDKLEQGPLSIQQISQEVGSNWLTISKFLEELKNERKVREIILRENARLFRLAREDTYLDIPIGKEYKKLGFYLFQKIRETWQEKTGRVPKNTEVLKTAVEVLERTGLNKEIPTVWYLYGKIPVLKYSPESEYRIEISSVKIKNLDIKNFDGQILKAVGVFSASKRTQEIRVRQYELYNNKLYQLKERIISSLINSDISKEEIKNLSSSLYAYCPSKEDASEILQITQEFVSVIYKLSLIKNIEGLRKDILETFIGLWRMIATYMFYDSLTQYEKFKDREKTRDFYFSDSMYNRISSAEELVSNLSSIYLNNTSELEEPQALPDTPEAKMLRDIFFEMSIEGTKENDKSIS